MVAPHFIGSFLCLEEWDAYVVRLDRIGVVGKILHFINPNFVLSKTYLVPRSPVTKEKGDRSHFYNEISVQDWFETGQLVKLFGEKGYVSFKV